MLPAMTSATTFERNRTSAPNASDHAPCPTHTPTTPSGGTSEIEIATPGSTALRSRRHIANAPAVPGRERGEQVEQVRRGAAEDLRVRLEALRVGDEEREDPARGQTTITRPIATQKSERSDEGEVTRDDPERDAEDRRAERRDDHGADDGGGRVGEDAADRDDRGEDQHDEEAGALGELVAVAEVERVLERLDRLTLRHRDQRAGEA